ncbi:hypothetical protein COEREDRAFT_82274 [Coemansia reversa NRRL 1564]|uniref:tRNA-splicing endonuclease subunit Sen15 domain-containing protein n=1 Tax=Coemansia reversa (strain ATCC 12441 / NRRL 1564) TaxID=763665 RepID=A0A2G5B8K8_COERN|nr:hypothetical protein COEREDRAFT_82274 [Coemansia reversa NRRL 1564]|eukprot:PIA15067.1 hypothetical protein COEREDRAFT_82274 [Coemansia reversa NRRL 1564]
MDAHPKFHEVSDVCRQVPERTRPLFQVYLDIKYVQMLKTVKAFVLDGIRFPVVTAQSDSGEIQIFAPMFADENTDIDYINAILEKSLNLSTSISGKCNREKVSVHLAIVDSDSTVTYYSIDSGIHFPAAIILAS